MKIIVALIILALIMAPQEVALYYKRKELERRWKEWELYQEWLKQQESDED